MKILITVLSLLFLNYTYAQNKKEYKEILKKEVSLSTLEENLDEFNYNFKTIIIHKFDSLDYEIFCGPAGNNAQLLALGVLKNSKKPREEKEKYTYKDLLDQLSEFRATDEYLKVREIIKARNEIISRNASLSSWVLIKN